MAADPFGDERGLRRALALDGDVPGHLYAVRFDALELRQREARAHARAYRHGRGEAHAVQPVVHAHLAVAEREGGLREVRQQRERQEPMGNRAAEGRILRPLPVDVDPLEILDRAREGIDALLGDLDPRRNADFLADTRLELADGAHRARKRSTRARVSAARRGAPAGSSRSSCARNDSYA